MSTRERWLDKGLDVLAQEGFRAVTIERLCTEMGLTKGSFYHHFGGVAGFQEALLEHFAYRETQRYVELADELTEAPARQRLERLRSLFLAQTDDSVALEVAVRNWAAEDEAARAALTTIDRQRLEYVESLLLEITGSAKDAQEISRMIYLIQLGGHYVLPPLTLDQITQLWDRLLSEL